MHFGGRAIHLWILIGTLLVGIGIGATGQRLVAAPPSFTETVLLRTDLVGMDKHELIVSRLETAPGWAHRRHYHAGHEIVYVLEGNGVLDTEGKSEQPLRPGTVSYVPPGQIHAGRNTDAKGVWALRDARNPVSERFLPDLRAAAEALGLKHQIVAVRELGELDSTFAG